MKTFSNFEDAFKWAGVVIEKTNPLVIEAVAEQVYKDSDKYTYRDSGEMYDSGALYSRFKDGYVIIKAPQVRFLYYGTNYNAGDGNRIAIPQWFEQTKIENMNTYKKMYITTFNQEKKG